MFDRDEQEISQVIEVGLEAILSGESTLEDVLAAHPEQAAAIRPELEAARWLLAQQAQVQTRPGFVAASRGRVVARIQAEAADHNAKHAFLGWVWPQRLAYRWVAALVIVVVLLSSTGGLVSASQGALPGDGLYLVKRITEEFVYTVTINTTQRVELSIKYARRRLQEAAALISKKNYEAVLPILQEFQQQVNQAVALLQQAANSSGQNANELREQKSVAMALKESLSQNADALAMMQSASLPPEVMNGVLDAQQFSQSSIDTTDELISGLNHTLGLPEELSTATPAPEDAQPPTPTYPPTQTVPPSPSSSGEIPGITTEQPGDAADEPDPVLITPTPTGKPTKIKPGNSSHLTPPPGQTKKENNPSKDKDPKPPKEDKSSSSNAQNNK